MGRAEVLPALKPKCRVVGIVAIAPKSDCRIRHLSSVVGRRSSVVRRPSSSSVVHPTQETGTLHGRNVARHRLERVSSRKKEPASHRVYPDGIHEALARPLRAAGFAVQTATLDEPEHGLTEERLDGNRRAALVGPHGARARCEDEIVDRVQRARAGRDGPDRAALRPLLEDLQEADGHDLQPEVARGRRARASSGSSRPGHPIAEGDRPRTSTCRRQEMYGEFFDIPEPDALVFISWFEGGEVFRSGCCFTRGQGQHLLLPPRPRDLPDLRAAGGAAGDRERGALGRPDAAPDRSSSAIARSR